MARQFFRRLRRDLSEVREALIAIPSLLHSIHALHKSMYERDPSSVYFHLRNKANDSSAKFILDNLNKGTLIFKRRDSLWTYVIKLIASAEPEELFLEFGVYRGASITFFASHLPERKFYGFDSFAGLRENWTGTPGIKETFKVSEQEVSVPKNVELVKGYFQDTLVNFLDKHQSQVSFIHIDSDTFDSAMYVLKSLNPRITTGTIILFDEFIGYPGYEHGEFAAFHNWVGTREYEYLAFYDQKALIRILT